MSNTTTKANPFPPISGKPADLTSAIEMFCTDIRFGHDIQNCEVRQGGFHNVIMFDYIPFATSSDPTHPPPSNHQQSCILRTGKEILIDSSNMRCEATERIVAVMHAYGEGGAQPSHLPIPAILAYDVTYNNVIKCPYIIQRRAAGNDLQKWYKLLGGLEVPATGPDDLTERLRIAEEIAILVASMETSFVFQEYGDLIPEWDMPAKNMAFVGEGIEIGIRGPLVGRVQIPSTLHHIDMIESLIKARIEMTSAESGVSQAEHPNVVELGEIFQHMKQEGRLGRFSAVATLWHQDLYPRNIIFDRAGADQKMKLTAVIDWDGAMVLPRIMTREPPKWLWTTRLTPKNQRRIIKEHFYDCIERLVPGYRQDADGREAVVVRALYVYAFWGTDYEYHSELSFEEFLEEWHQTG